MKPTPHRKKLIEVALPLAKINEAAVRENYIYKGNPSAIHKWWAQRPLVACRAVLFASLVDDPDSDPAYRRADDSVDEERAGVKRAELFDLIEQLVLWENSNNPRVINQARAEIARCVASRKIETGEMKKDALLTLPGVSERVTPWNFVIRQAAPGAVNAFLAEHAPPVLDPFCGGGSIPLEAQRLGLRAIASDLNPVPVLITKALIEIPPKFAGRPPVNLESRGKRLVNWSGAQGLAEDVRYYGKWVRDAAQRHLGHLYPRVKVEMTAVKGRPDLEPDVGQELTIIAWLWARTVASPNPTCMGAHVPLVRSFSVSTRKGKPAWIEPIIDRERMTYRLEVRVGTGSPVEGTVGKRVDRCLLTGSPIPRDHTRTEGQAGRLKYRLLAIVAEGSQGRVYLSPTDDQEKLALSAVPPEDVADVAIVGDPRYLTPTTYGMTKFRDLFTPRQLLALSTLSQLVEEARAKILADSGDESYASAVATYLAFAVDKFAEYNCSLIPWYSKEDRPHHLFSRQALPMVWDFAELNPFSEIGGSFLKSLNIVAESLAGMPSSVIAGTVGQLSVTEIQTSQPVLLSTDPPYYDNVPYADLSDFFYVWLRRMLNRYYPDLLTTLLVPKTQELVADPFRHGGRDAAMAFFEQGISRAFAKLQSAADHELPATIYYAFKQAEAEEGSADTASERGDTRVSTGWETFLQGLLEGGWQITGTWPLRTERTGRIRDNASNALASSIVLVCRARSANAPQATRKQFIAALRKELPEALRNLQHGNIAPVDLAQAAIGPGMAVFTRYSKVLESGDEPMSVRTALGIINQVLDEILAEQEGEFDASSRWAIAWFEQYGMDAGPFGEAEVLSKAKNTGLNRLIEAGVVQSRSGKVWLTPRAEMPEDAVGTVWQAAQQLIRALDARGESGAATLLRRLGGTAEIARDLAYRLYTVCERKKWAEEARAYNGLVVAWPELVKLAQSGEDAPGLTQQEFS